MGLGSSSAGSLLTALIPRPCSPGEAGQKPGTKSISICQVKGQCCAQGNPSRSTNQTIHSTVELSAASPITRNKTRGPRPAHSSPWPTQPPYLSLCHGGFIWFSKVPPQPSGALAHPWALDSCPSGLPPCPYHLDTPARTISNHPSQTLINKAVSSSTLVALTAHYPYCDLIFLHLLIS